MSETRIVVDPLTRIEGHMRMQAVLGADGKIATPGPPARCGAALK